MGRRKVPEEHENHERWLVSYADFITLLFAFFTALYAMSSVSESKYRAIAQSLNSAFNPIAADETVVESGKSMLDEQTRDFAAEFKEVFTGDYKKLKNSLEDLQRAKDLEVVLDERGVIVRINEGMLFGAGSSDLKDGSIPVLDEVVVAIKELKKEVRVEGHTDNIPISTPDHPSNWDLSTERSLNILKYFTESHEYDPKMIGATGYGEHRPISTNDTPRGRKMNRRVDILILK